MYKYFFCFFLFVLGINFNLYSQSTNDTINDKSRPYIVRYCPYSLSLDSVPKVKLPDSLGGNLLKGRIVTYVYLNDNGDIKDYEIFVIHLRNKKTNKIIVDYKKNIKKIKPSKSETIKKYDNFIRIWFF